MTEDDKVAFYLRHWKQMAEWAVLRKRAAEQLDQALIDAVGQLASVEETAHVDLQASGTRIARLHIDQPSHDAWLEFQWERARLFEGGWPRMIVVWNKKHSTEAARAALKQTTAEVCAALGMTRGHGPRDWWVWSSELAASEEPFDIDEFARSCAEEYRQAWVALRHLLGAAAAV